MIGMVLVTHGALAEEFRAALEHVVGAQKNLAPAAWGAAKLMFDFRQCRVSVFYDQRCCRHDFVMAAAFAPNPEI